MTATKSLPGILSQQGAAPPPSGPQPGDMWIRRNASDSSTTLANGTPGTEVSLGWDTEVHRDTAFDAGDYSAGEFTLPAGIYWVAQSVRFDSSGGANRSQWLSYLDVGDGGHHYAPGWGYLRRTSGDDEHMDGGSAIIELAAETTVDVKAYRDDSNTAGVVRTAGHGGVQIMALDDDHAFGLYRHTGEVAGTDNEADYDIVLNTTDREDTGFSRSGNTITIADAGTYVVAYGLLTRHATASREWMRTWLEDSSGVIVGTTGFAYLRGSNACYEGAPSACMIFEQTGTNVTYNLKGNASNIAHWNRDVSLAFWKLPAGAKWAAHQATTGDLQNKTYTTFTWDTLPQIDTDKFTASAGGTVIDVDQAGDYMAFAAIEDSSTSGARTTHSLQFDVEGTQQLHATAGTYDRGTGYHNGMCQSILLPGLSANDSISVEQMHWSTTNNAIAATGGKFAALDLASVFA